MEVVSFISAETGDDLILSFAIQDPYDPLEIESLILLRTPNFEFALEEDERGVKVSFERYGDEEELLKEVSFYRKDKRLEIKTDGRSYELDLHNVDQKEVNAMSRLLEKMNFDRSITLNGI